MSKNNLETSLEGSYWLCADRWGEYLYPVEPIWDESSQFWSADDEEGNAIDFLDLSENNTLRELFNLPEISEEEDPIKLEIKTIVSW